MMISKFLTFVLFFACSVLAVSAQPQILTSKVINAQTQKPVVHAEIFISGTMVGSISDSLGNFTLKVPFLPCVLVVNHVSYESFIKPITSVQNMSIELSPENFKIKEVSVKGKNKRRRNLRFFYSHFIKKNKNEIELLNDSVLHFYRDEMKFRASCNEPLIIQNNYLGYQIKVVLEEFEVTAKDSPNGKCVPLNSLNGGFLLQLTGYYYYQPLEKQFPNKENYFIKNRKENYYGSYRHFLKSIYNNSPEQNGFEILSASGNEENLFQKVPADEWVTGNKKFRFNADTLNITYHFDDKKFPISKEEIQGRNYQYIQRSVIYATNLPFVVRSNGTSPKLTFILEGHMAVKSFANSLPDDYDPPVK